MKLCIIGKGSGWEDAPGDIETWGITQTNLRRKVSRVIDMNDYALWGPIEAEDARRSREKARQDGITYIDRDNYPLQDVIAQFGTDYFTSTVDYALAMALYEGFTEIDLYGVNMANHTEYAYQKPGCEFWCGMAKGMGVKVNVHGKLSTLMRTKDGKIYGYGIKQNRRVYATEEDNGPEGLCV